LKQYYGVTIREKGTVVFESTIIPSEDGLEFLVIKNNVFWKEKISNLIGQKIKIAQEFDVYRELKDIYDVLMYLKDIGVDIEYKTFTE